jgi:hypothetical protein
MIEEYWGLGDVCCGDDPAATVMNASESGCDLTKVVRLLSETLLRQGSGQTNEMRRNNICVLAPVTGVPSLLEFYNSSSHQSAENFPGQASVHGQGGAVDG